MWTFKAYLIYEMDTNDNKSRHKNWNNKIMPICPEVLHYVTEVGKQEDDTDLLFQGWECPVYIIN
jgi:hypothetical protein